MKPNVKIRGNKKDGYFIEYEDKFTSGGIAVTWEELIEINVLSSRIINKEYNKEIDV